MLESLSAFDYYLVLDNRQEPSLVCFTKPSCGGCRTLKKILLDSPLTIPSLRCFEVQVEDAYGIVEDLEIVHLPTMLLYYKGDLHREIFSVLRPQAIQQAIEIALSQPPQEDRE